MGLDDVVLGLFAGGEGQAAAAAPADAAPPSASEDPQTPATVGTPRARGAVVSANPMRRLDAPSSSTGRGAGGSSSRILRAHTHHGASLSHLLDPLPFAGSPAAGGAGAARHATPPRMPVVQLNPLGGGGGLAADHTATAAGGRGTSPASARPPSTIIVNPFGTAAASAALARAPGGPRVSAFATSRHSTNGSVGVANPFARALEAAATGAPLPLDLDLSDRPQRVQRLSTRPPGPGNAGAATAPAPWATTGAPPGDAEDCALPGTPR